MTTIKPQIKLGGIPTDMQSVAFGDSTGTLGVVRNDTGANVIPPGTPLAHDTGVGNYIYGPFNDPAPGLTYTYYLTLVTPAGLTVYSPSGTAAPLPAIGNTDGTGYYTTQALIEQRAGAYNADLWSNRGDGSSSLPDSKGFLDAIGEVDSFINWKADEEGYTTPIPTTIKNWLRLQNLATKLGEALLYINARGLHDDDNVGKGMDAQRQQAIAEIEEFITAGISDAPQTSTTPVAAIAAVPLPFPACGIAAVYPASRSWPSFF